MTKRTCIYLIEDDATIVNLLTSHLADRYQVVSVSNFRDVLTEIRAFQPDLILMDIGLPYFNGFYWTAKIREELTTPILFLTSSVDETSAITAMATGADDFISKPFSLPLLEAKLAAFLRRSQQFAKNQLVIDGWQLELDGHFGCGTDQVLLSPTETKLMALLIEHHPQTVSKDKLLDRLWEGGDFIDANTLSVNMTRLRKKLVSIGFERIATIRGKGYQLT